MKLILLLRDFLVALGLMAALAFCAVGCTSTYVTGSPEYNALYKEILNRKGIKETIQEGKTWEDCKKLETGETISYSFAALNTLDFNIHYHDEAGNTSYLVQKTAVDSDEGSALANRYGHYCLSWTNRSHQQPIEILYEFKVVLKPN